MNRRGFTTSRREFLERSRFGLGMLAFADLLTQRGHAVAPRPGHFAPKAKSVILLFMDGGVSHVDSFDPKPRLQRESGQPFKMRVEATQFDRNGNALGSPFAFRRHGQAGIPVSSLFPHIARHVDDLCVIRSMRSPFAEHSMSVYLLHTGNPIRGRPSMGSWVSYALGSECANLPSYVILDGGQLPLGGIANFSAGFIPAIHEGTLFSVIEGQPIVANIQSPDPVPVRRDNRLRFITGQDQRFADSLGGAGAPVESAIRNYELALSMQHAVPEVNDLNGETQGTLERYGLTSKNQLTARYGRQCLLARRLLERGVRFIELSAVSGIRNVSPWDSHNNIKEEHQQNADVVDRPIGALLGDLKARGLLDETLVVWAGEFGRTPFAQGSLGRDHNPQGYTIWLAGGGVRGGVIHGATDEYGYHAIDEVVSLHDLHATILHLLGLDHTKLTFRYAGRDFRLTDVHGEVVRDILK